eukprot:scaffold47287_cov44-Phaeocystis_antarctica.AAC.1
MKDKADRNTQRPAARTKLRCLPPAHDAGPCAKQSASARPVCVQPALLCLDPGRPRLLYVCARADRARAGSAACAEANCVQLVLLFATAIAICIA